MKIEKHDGYVKELGLTEKMVWNEVGMEMSVGEKVKIFSPQ